ncbi:DNA-binding transcriptional LysR family regulator [Paenibacillus sp. JGP012]|uniref:LysR family transcriptional regulator n=1 Tax=Paenibacillus sp. JGP012 TaxID=2735914 RepID=UPI00160D2EA1|nr:LysR family transcriptional regulator [Paenibacillus sp. JGP012]MBB6024416.1 DNA-binding transcriptional LysR family regulator [Paenibacillus sp. JGP012]
MNLIKLQIVELIDKHHHMTSVADILGIKQPTVTFHMKSLEEEMGVRLFESRSGKTFLTEAGQALLHYCVKINALTQEARRVVKEYDSLYRGTLHIGASYVPATYLLPAMLHTFSQEFPGIRIVLSVKPAPVIRQMVIQHQLDLGILSSEPFVGPILHAETLCKDDLVLICSPQHGLAHRDSVEPEDIASIPFALHGDESSTRRLTNHWLTQHEVRLRSTVEMDSLEAIKQLVLIGGHISFMSRMAVQWEERQGIIQVLPIPGEQAPRHIYMVHNKDRLPSVQMNRFKEVLQEVVGMKSFSLQQEPIG